MADRKYLYAYVILAENGTRFGAMGGAIVARSDEEADGIVRRRAREEYPEKGGWERHQSSADRISDESLHAAGWTWIPGPPTETGR